MTIHQTSYEDLESYLKSAADQQALQPYIWHPEAAKMPGSPINLLQEDTKFRAKLLLGSITGLLHTTIHSQTTGTKIVIYQNGKWNPTFIRGLEFRAGTEFLQNSYLGEWWILSWLLEYAKLAYAKQQDVAIGDSTKLWYTDDGTLYLEKTEDKNPKAPRPPRVRAISYKPRMAYDGNPHKTM